MKKEDFFIHEPSFTVRDFITVIKRSKGKLFFVFLFSFFSCVTAFFIFPPKVTINASFREVADTTSPKEAMEEMMMEMAPMQKSGEGIILMKSHLFLKPLIEKLALQAKVTRMPLTSYLLENMKKNFKKEIFQQPIGDGDSPQLENLIYDGKQKKRFYLCFEGRGYFVLLDKQKRFLKRGEIGKPFSYKDLSFTLVSKADTEEYRLLLEPWTHTAIKLQKNLFLKQQKRAKNFITVRFKDVNYKRGEAFLSLLIDRYLCFLEEENQTLTQKQLAYLSERKELLTTEVEGNLENYKDWLEKNLQEEGVLNVGQAIEKFSHSKKHYTEEFSRLENLYTKFSSSQREGSQNDLEEKIDSLDEFLNSDDWHLAKDGHFGAELQRLSSTWQRLKEEKKTIQNWQTPKRKQIISAKQIEHKYPKFRNLTIDLAKDFYLSYQKKQEELLHRQKMLMQLRREFKKDPKILTSSMADLVDPVSQKTIESIIEILGKIEQKLYITEKERIRWEEQFSKKQAFMQLHLNRLITATKVEISLIGEKLSLLKQVAIEKIDLKMGSVKEEIDLFFEKTAKSVEKEKAFWKEKLSSVEDKTKNIPHLWKEEKALKLESDMNLSKMDFLTQLIETKVLTKQIEQTKARSIDAPSSTWKSDFSSILLSFALAIFVVFSYYIILFIRSAFGGAIITTDLLQSFGLRAFSQEELVYGLQTFAKTCIRKKEVMTSFSIGLINLPESFILGLAKIFARRKEKTLLVYCDYYGKEELGFTHYLSGKILTLPIATSSEYDLLVAGERINNKADILLNEDFSTLLKELKLTYDWILIITEERAKHPIGIHVAELVDTLCVNTEKLTLKDLQPYFHDRATFFV